MGSNRYQAAQYSAILDEKTCPLCRHLDGKQIALENPELKEFTPPIHDGCRCEWVYILEDEQDVQITWQSPPSELIEKHGRAARRN